MPTRMHCGTSGCPALADDSDRLARNVRPTARIVRFALAAMLAATGGWVTAATPATIDVTAERHGDDIRIHAQAWLTADAASAWRVLTDYAGYPAFIPDLHRSRVVAREGAVVTVEQSGVARVWLLLVPLDVRYEITESPPWELRSRAVAGSLRALQSHYRLVPEPAGLRLDYDGDVTPGTVLSDPVEQYAVRAHATRQFQALVDEIERRSASGQ